jgi:membrane-associated protease RseP (regulator of RpoE activity)
MMQGEQGAGRARLLLEKTRMRTMLIALLLGLAACDAPESPLRQVTIESPEALGLALREMPASALRSAGLAYGLSVIKAGSLAERAGLHVGDIVYAVNEQRLRSIEDFTRIVAAQPGGSLALLVRRGKADFYVPVDLSGAPPSARDTLLRT